MFIDFSQLKAALPYSDVIGLLGLNIRQHGNQWRGPCPACKNSGDRALVVTEGKGFFCFASQKGGDQIALAAHVLGLSVKDAAETLAKKSGKVQVPEQRNSTVPPNSTVPESEKGKQGDRTLQPLSYLLASHEAVQKLGVSAATAEHFGAGYAPKGILRGRLAIPIHDRSGVLLAYCGRALGQEGPTLAFPNGFRPESVIFNAHQIETGADLYLTRDPIAVLTAFENGIGNVVAFLAERITSEQLETLASLMDEKQIEAVELF